MAIADARRRRGAALLALAGFLVLCLGVGITASIATRPAIEGWYQTLAKPSFTPPNGLFAPVWTVLYIAMAVAAWRVWRQPASRLRSRALALFAIQLALNFAWSWVFFGAKSPAGGLVVIMALLAAIVATALVFARLDRIAAALFLPYIAWVGFASALNGAIVALN